MPYDSEHITTGDIGFNMFQDHPTQGPRDLPSAKPPLWGPAVSRLLWPPSGTSNVTGTYGNHLGVYPKKPGLESKKVQITYFRMG